NCGVRVLTTSIQVDELRPHLDSLMTALFRNIGTGVGASGQLRLSVSEMHELLEGGSEWVIKRGYGRREDLAYTEDGGRMPDARAEAVSPRAIERGQNQVGTLGSGNHFLELDEVVEIFDHEAAQAFGLIEGTVTVWIHCGSRGLGHQVCTDAVREMQQSVRKYGIEIPDRELVCSPFSSPEGQRYFQAMSAAANYAWANRQVITHHVRQTFEEVLAGKLPRPDLRLLYDVCHNIAKVERHKINGEEREVCVHRKGATRTFGPGLPQVPEDYRQIGQPVLIPGSMGVGSYILVGTEGAMEQTFGSSCHGAGRMWSRSKALREVQGSKLRAELEKENILVRAGSMRGLAEEAPDAYKDVDAVVDVVHNTGIARRVARTRPIGVIKG
ncbi:MAG TPA: RtcB family protein, partial [Chloroflexi bacterium]|nr:RtcB family protein [Chloroflexota bacterium]